MLGWPGRFRNDLFDRIQISARVSHFFVFKTLWLDVPENTSRDITTSSNSDHKIRPEYIQDLFSGDLTKLVHLFSTSLVS